MAINLNHYKSAIEIPVGATPDTPSSGGTLFVKTDGKLYWKDTVGNDYLADGTNVADGDVNPYGADITNKTYQASFSATEGYGVNDMFTEIRGIAFSADYTKVYIAGALQKVEEVADPSLNYDVTDFTLSNNSIHNATFDWFELSAGSTLGITHNTNATISRSYYITYRREGTSTSSVAPVCGGVSLTARTASGVYTETIVATGATSIFAVTGTVGDTDIQFSLISVQHEISPGDGIRVFNVDTMTDSSLTLTSTYEWFDFTSVTDVRGLTLSTDETKFIVGDAGGDQVYEINLLGAGRLNGATEEATPFNPTELTALETTFVDPTGKFLYVGTSDTATPTIYQYEMTTAWDLDTATYTVQSLNISGNTSGDFSIIIDGDGQKLQVLDHDQGVEQWSLSDPWQIDSGTFDSVTVTTSGQSTNMGSLVFSPNHEKVICGGITTQELYAYDDSPTTRTKRASESQEGITRYATVLEAETAKSTNLAISPYTLKKWGAANAGIVTEDLSQNNIIGGNNAGAEIGVASIQNIFLGISAFSSNNGADVDDCVFIGYQAGINIETAIARTVAIGSSAHTQSATNKTGSSDGVFIGYRAGLHTKGSYNVAVGTEAMRGPTSGMTGTHNTAVGYRAFDNSQQSTNQNTAIGALTLDGLFGTTSNDNTAVGYNALTALGSNCGTNTAIGSGAGQTVALGSGNVFVGYNAGPVSGNVSNQLFINNVASATPLIHGDFSGGTVTVNGDLVVTGSGGPFFIQDGVNGSIYGGTNAGANMTSNAFNNFLAGTNAATYLENGDQNIAIGHNAMFGSAVTALDGNANIAIGYQSLNVLQGAAANNTGLGNQAGLALTTGASNTAVGSLSLQEATTHSSNVAVGHAAAQYMANSFNTAVGANALKGVTATSNGDSNVAVGYNAGVAMTTGDDNVFIGYNAAVAATTDAANIAIGWSVAGALNGGSGNVILGKSAGNNISTGLNNVIIGYQAGPTTNQSNQLFIHNDESNTPLIHGDFATPKITINGALETTGIFTIDNATPQIKLYESDAALDEKFWRFRAVAGQLIWDIHNDANTVTDTIATVDRTANVLDDITFHLPVVTNARITSSSATAQFFLEETDATANEGKWDFLANGDTLYCRAINDAESGTLNLWHVTRTAVSAATLLLDVPVETASGLQINTEIYFDAEVSNGTATAINWTNGNKQLIAPTAATSPTYTFTAPSGPTNLTLRTTNLGAVTAVTWPATVKWPGGTEPTWTSSGTDIISFYYDGTNYHGSASIDSK